jgi:hypothetical protein
MNKILALLTYFILNSLLLFAQNEETDVTNPGSLTKLEISLDADEKCMEKLSLPFQNIKVIDSRFDTGKIGFIPHNLFSQKRMFKRVTLKKGLANEAAGFLNRYYENVFAKNGYELLIVIKKLWFSGIDNSKTGGAELATTFNSFYHIYCKWEFYIGKNDSYMPIIRIDTILDWNDTNGSFKEENFTKSKFSKLKSVLCAITELPKYDTYFSLYESKAKKTMDDIVKFNENRFNLPVLKQGIFEKGVYLNFEEFKNNKPSIIDFKEKKMNYGLLKKEFYLEKLNGEPVNKYWGYSSGEWFKYGRYGNDKIYREGNTFEFFVQAVYTDADSRIDSKIWMPYQLDMETGKIY